MMKTMSADRFLIGVMSVAMAILVAPSLTQASSISMPAGARSWIVVSSGDCDDDGQGTVDRGHCAAAVSELNQAGDIGHDIYPNYQILANALIGPDAMHGSVQSTPNALFVFLDMSMIDTYTLSSSSLAAGTVVPVTVSFHAVGNLFPQGIYSNSGVLLGFGGGVFTTRIGNGFNSAPIVIPENSRVSGPLSATASATFSLFNAPSTATIPLDLTATHTFDVTIGTPFDLAFYLGARPSAATIDFSNTASILFTLPEGTVMTSTGGYGNPTPVRKASWGAVKALYR